MTTVAWDGQVIAADRRMTTDNGRVKTNKIVRAGRFIYAQVGENAADCELVREWLEAGAKPTNRPKLSQGAKSHGFAIDVRSGDLFLIDGQYPTLQLVEEKQYAAGSGGDFARGAMACGCDAIQAVRIASEFDPGTGDGVDHVTVKTRRPKAKAKRT